MGERRLYEQRELQQVIARGLSVLEMCPIAYGLFIGASRPYGELSKDSEAQELLRAGCVWHV
jgi:hypothetical protein